MSAWADSMIATLRPRANDARSSGETTLQVTDEEYDRVREELDELGLIPWSQDGRLLVYGLGLRRPDDP